MPPEVVFLIGLPAAGKTTFYRTRFSTTHIQISKDNFRNARRPEKRQLRMLREALSRGCHVVIDNTNAATEDRAGSLQVAREHGSRLIAYFFLLTPDESIERNKARSEAEAVPNVGVYSTAKRLTMPSFDEGFRQIFHVRAEEGVFNVREIQPPGSAGAE